MGVLDELVVDDVDAVRERAALPLPGAQSAGLIRMLLATVTPVNRPRSCNTGSLLLFAGVAPCSMMLKANRQSLISTPPTLPASTWLNATMERACWLGGTTLDRPLSDMRVDAFWSARVQYMILNSRGAS